MKTYVVVGLGRFGTSIAEKLQELGNEVMVIDESEDQVQRLSERVTYAVVGDARDEEVLRSLGVGNFDCAVVAIGGDLAASILITLNLKALGVPQVICKAPKLTMLLKPGLMKIQVIRMNTKKRIATIREKYLNPSRSTSFVEERSSITAWISFTALYSSVGR